MILPFELREFWPCPARCVQAVLHTKAELQGSSSGARSRQFADRRTWVVEAFLFGLRLACGAPGSNVGFFRQWASVTSILSIGCNWLSVSSPCSKKR
jgi:hypothetical protein